jgi:hypothetical protein
MMRGGGGGGEGERRVGRNAIYGRCYGTTAKKKVL